jgi:hypothetical protein
VQIIILILESTPDAGVLNFTIDCIKRCTEIWTAMDVKARLVEALLERYLVSRSTANPHRALLELLLQAAEAGLLHEELKMALLQDQAVFQMDQVSRRLGLIFRFLCLLLTPPIPCHSSRPCRSFLATSRLRLARPRICSLR